MRATAVQGPTPMRGVFSFVIGFVCGWAARSTVDSPQALGVRAMAVAYETKARLSRWIAVEKERVTDMLAEAQSRVGQDTLASSVPQDEP